MPSQDRFDVWKSTPLWVQKKAACVSTTCRLGCMKGVLVKDQNLKHDSYGGARPDGRSTKTLKAGTEVVINKVVTAPKPGQVYTVHVNEQGWIEAEAIKLEMPKSHHSKGC